jgi:hypothetical protein
MSEGIARRDGQESLFDAGSLRPIPDHVGYRGPVACAAAGITYRQLDYWARTGLVEPTVRGGQGVFGIAVGSVWREVEGTLATLPAEDPAGEPVLPVSVTDELARRRASRAAV